MAQFMLNKLNLTKLSDRIIRHNSQIGYVAQKVMEKKNSDMRKTPYGIYPRGIVKFLFLLSFR